MDKKQIKTACYGNRLISFAPSIKGRPHPCPLADAIDGIRGGQWREDVEKCRAAKGEEQRRLKQALPVFHFGGTFEENAPAKMTH